MSDVTRDRKLENRTMSGFPVSVGTGLALETLFEPAMAVVDPDRKFDKVEDLRVYNSVYINVETLIRNIINAVDSEARYNIRPLYYYRELLMEIQFLRSFFGQNGIELVIYDNTLDSYIKKYFDDLRPVTSKGAILEEQITNFARANYNRDQVNLTGFKGPLKGDKNKRILIMTHYAVELLSHDEFKSMDLLESHTGKIKSRKDFYTKYYKLAGKDMSFLPMVESLLVIFGDSHFFKPKPSKVREEVYDLLRTKNVNPLTSDYSIKIFLEKIK